MAEPPFTILESVVDDVKGRDAGKRILLVTTMWDSAKLDKAKAESREGEIRTSHWNRMIAIGSDIARFDNTSKSALNIVNLLLSNLDSPTDE